MAHLKTDFLANNENLGHVNLLPSKNLDEATRKHTIKKQAFGEIKNVIHNQYTTNGQKSDEVPGKSNREYEGLFPNGCKQRNKQQDVGTTQKSAKSFTPSTTLMEDGIEMLNFFDFDRKCCRESYKSDRQIWSDMNMFDDAMLDNIIKTAFAGDDEKTGNDDDFDLDKSDSEDILEINSSKLFPAVFSEHDDGSDDILLPCIQLEKFDFF